MDIGLVNKLFVSAFVRHYHLVPKRNSFLTKHIIDAQSEYHETLEAFEYQLQKMGCEYSLEDLTEMFEFVLSPSDRKISGAIYTPKVIRERIVDEVVQGLDTHQLGEKRFADISCGCGGFFLTIADLIHRRTNKSFSEIYRENIIGIDIQDYAIERTKLLLSLLALMHGEDENFVFNLHVANTLRFDFATITPIDIVVGNPPYVCTRNMTDESRQLLDRWSVCRAGNSDLYIPFFQIATEIVQDGGRVGLITMNSFLTSLNGRLLRKYFSKKMLDLRIVDFKGYQVFRGKNTYTCLFFLTKVFSECVSYCLNISTLLPRAFEYEKYPYSVLKDWEGWKFDGVSANAEVSGTTLGQYCRSRHGIATLKNEVYVFKPSCETKEFYVMEKNGKRYYIEKAICRDVVNSNKFNSDVMLEDIIEKVIYPYRMNDRGQVIILPEDEIKRNFPSAYKYLVSQRGVLAKRDKGKTGGYSAWYAYGRTQSLVMPQYKLFFPKIANRKLRCVISDDPSLLLYNGISFVDDNVEKIHVLKRVLESDSFWNYVKTNAKPYSSGYYSITGKSILSYIIPEKAFL